MAKKKRDESEAESQAHLNNNAERNKKPESEVEFVNGDSHKKINKKKKKKKKGEKEKNNTELNEKPTVTIALPDSIIHNAQSLELVTRLAGQIARPVTIFRIDEVVVFDNKSTSYDDSSFTLGDSSNENETGSTFLIRIWRDYCPSLMLYIICASMNGVHIVRCCENLILWIILCKAFSQLVFPRLTIRMLE